MWRLATICSVKLISPIVRGGVGARGLAAAVVSAPHLSATSVHAVLAAASASSPLKDAAKFYGPSDEVAGPSASSDGTSPLSNGVDLWTYRELYTHVGALAAGLTEVGFTAGNKIATCMPSGSQEYITLVLAASEVGVTVVAIEPPANPSAVDTAPIRAALDKFQPRALVLWHAYKTTVADKSTVSSRSTSILSALAPSPLSDETLGLASFSRMTERPVKLEEYPSLDYVIHTGEEHIRGAIAFKSLLNYSTSERVPTSSPSDVVLIEAASGSKLTHGDLMSGAQEIGSKLSLVSDPYSKNGKIVLKPEPSSAAATAVVSAVMHEALVISTGFSSNFERCASAAEAENALIA
jgi:acyl-CoA synthetase (AMP-forming)/AMP-acid ligase II